MAVCHRGACLFLVVSVPWHQEIESKRPLLADDMPMSDIVKEILDTYKASLFSFHVDCWHCWFGVSKASKRFPQRVRSFPSCPAKPWVPMSSQCRVCHGRMQATLRSTWRMSAIIHINSQGIGGKLWSANFISLPKNGLRLHLIFWPCACCRRLEAGAGRSHAKDRTYHEPIISKDTPET